MPEAALLLGRPVASSDDAERAVEALRALGARAVLLKGGHLDEGERVIDRYRDAAVALRFTHARLALEGHGTGCTLASAIAAGVCRGSALLDACREAADYVHGALVHAYRPGQGEVAVLDHFWRLQTRAEK
jgi:hydroxymethylpyrimidine/phosphomethylpyrimidine kinase